MKFDIEEGHEGWHLSNANYFKEKEEEEQEIFLLSITTSFHYLLLFLSTCMLCHLLDLHSTLTLYVKGTNLDKSYTLGEDENQLLSIINKYIKK